MLIDASPHPRTLNLMGSYQPTFTVEQIRAAEQPLLDAETEPDQLMRRAAHAVAQVAEMMLAWPLSRFHREGEPVRVLVLAGPGGNGGDALYAGAELAESGFAVDALLTAGKAHKRALKTFKKAGGRVLKELTWITAPLGHYALAIDGITGIGGSAGLREELEPIVDYADEYRRGIRVLAVDVPSGVEADTGEAGDLHMEADVTVTFGGWRRAHALAPQCGIQLLADIGFDGMSLEDELEQILENAGDDAESDAGPDIWLSATRAVVPKLELPEGITTLEPTPGLPIEPDAGSDKYSGGVVGIRAGSGQYPGTAILSTAGAVNATPAMVRYAGPQALEVVRAHPEVVATKTLREAGRVQAWVFGPGAGTGDTAAKELKWVLAQEVPVLVDADGLTLLAQRPELRKLVREREEFTVLTPHDGEFARLREALGLPETNRLEETVALARELSCTVVRKGRFTLIATEEGPEGVLAVDAGHSWAATPGSGDVLSGMLGAALALEDAWVNIGDWVLAPAVSAHQIAAKLAAETPYGDAAAPASRIAEHIRPAVALLNRGDARG